MGAKADVVGRLFDALIVKQDMAGARALFADDVRFTYYGQSSVAGEYKGPDEFFGLFGTIMEKTGGTYAPELHDVTDSDEHAVVLVNIKAQRGGKSYAYGHTVVFHVEGGKVTEGFASDTDETMVKELFA